MCKIIAQCRPLPRRIAYDRGLRDGRQKRKWPRKEAIRQPPAMAGAEVIADQNGISSSMSSKLGFFAALGLAPP